MQTSDLLQLGGPLVIRQAAGTLDTDFLEERDLIIPAGHKELKGQADKAYKYWEAIRPAVAETSFPKFLIIT